MADSKMNSTNYLKKILSRLLLATPKITNFLVSSKERAVNNLVPGKRDLSPQPSPIKASRPFGNTFIFFILRTSLMQTKGLTTFDESNLRPNSSMIFYSDSNSLNGSQLSIGLFNTVLQEKFALMKIAPGVKEAQHLFILDALIGYRSL